MLTDTDRVMFEKWIADTRRELLGKLGDELRKLGKITVGAEWYAKLEECMMERAGSMGCPWTEGYKPTLLFRGLPVVVSEEQENRERACRG